MYLLREKPSCASHSPQTNHTMMMMKMMAHRIITTRLLPNTFAAIQRTTPPPLSLSQQRNASSSTPSSSSHQLNVAFALIKSSERDTFTSILSQPVTTLQGIGPKHAAELQTLGITTIQQLATYKFFHLARAIDTLSTTEERPNGRLDGTLMNIDNGVDKAYEHLYLCDILEAPVSALEGISEEKGKVWNDLGCKTVKDLAHWKYARWADAIVTASKFEQGGG